MDLALAKKEFSQFVNGSDYNIPISELYNMFVVEKMALDKYFSVFLEESEDEMSQSQNFDSPAWKIYKEKLKEYDEIEKLVTRSRYYLNKNV